MSTYSRIIGWLSLATWLLTACAAGSPNRSTPVTSSPSPSPSPTAASLAEAEAQFCAELPMVQDAFRATLQVQQNPTRQNVTKAVTLLRSEAGRLEVIADAFDEAGDSLKASDIRALADGLAQNADDFSRILEGGLPGAGANVAILVEQALQGINC